MLKLLLTSILCLLVLAHSPTLPDSQRAADARAAVWPKMEKELRDRGFDRNYRIYLRIIKQTDLFEIWAKKGNRYEIFNRYDICYYSGNLGTKTRRGDNKSPEGFYTIDAGSLHPMSTYHLALNIGYPNELEKQLGYTGDAIMVHGRCASVGCYAMTNPGIEQIYTMVYKALEAGQERVQLDIFPFYMDKEHMATFGKSPYLPLWKTMQPAYDYFERTHLPPVVTVVNKRYSVAP